MRFNRDYYRILGVSSTASPDEIKRAFRRLARQYHPDVNEAPNAEARFKALNEAYQVLSDPAKRAAYDRFHRSGVYTTPYPRQRSSYGSRGYSYTQTRQGASPTRRTARGLGNLSPARLGILQRLAITIIGAAIVLTVALVPHEIILWSIIIALLLFSFFGGIRHFWQNYRAERSRIQSGRIPYNWVLGVLGTMLAGSYFLQQPPRNPVIIMLGLALVNLSFFIPPDWRRS
jgi:curved DNA-binding protein CbpA